MQSNLNVRVAKLAPRKISFLNVLTGFNYQFKNVQMVCNFLRKIKLVYPVICFEPELGRLKISSACSLHCVTDFKYIQCILVVYLINFQYLCQDVCRATLPYDLAAVHLKWDAWPDWSFFWQVWRSFLASMDEEPAAVSDFREIVYGIETEQVNKSPKISDFIIE